jgi:lipopolysaccharide biosynthesis glycosyltransferase
MYDPAIAHIVYASDDGFAEILGVSLVSLLRTVGA